LKNSIQVAFLRQAFFFLMNAFLRQANLRKISIRYCEACSRKRKGLRA